MTPYTITYQQAHALFGPSVKTFSRRVKEGKIEAKMDGGRVLLIYSSVKAMIDALPDYNAGEVAE